MYRFLAPITAAILTAWRYRRGLLVRAMESVAYRWGMRWIVPRIRFTWKHASLPLWKILRGHKLLKPGHIILTTSHWQLTSMCIPGKLTHAAMCVGIHAEGAEYEVAEMVAAGYRKNDWPGVCQASRVVILECDAWDKDYTRRVVLTCKSFNGTPYDPLFAFGVKALYCSEMIWASDFARRLEASVSDLMGLGSAYVSPQDLFDAKNVTVIWDSDKEVKP